MALPSSANPFIMTTKAFWGIVLVLFIPLIAYFSLKKFTDRDVAMPRHYIPDSTIMVTKNGKQYVDTVWHKVADFELTNQMGQKVGWKDMEGKVVVADFFFTHCPTICPTLTLNMKALQDNIRYPDKMGGRDADFVQFLSFSIDPERDSVPQLKNWADRFQVDPRNWWLLTGDKKTIYDLSIKEMRVPAEDGGEIDTSFVHTDVFVLMDKHRNIRGYYHTILNDNDKGGYVPDSATLERLSRDIVLLALEKDPTAEKSFLAGKLEIIAVVFFLVAIGLVVGFKFLKKEKR